MFDLATRAQPASSGAVMLAGVPFDLRLAPPTAPRAHPYTSFVTDTAVPAPGTEMLAVYALALEGGLATAVILSLFTDARAGVDDVLPLGTADRRGWAGDEFMPASDGGLAAAGSDAWGSRLWLLYATKATDDVPARARFAAQQALAWLLRDGIAGRVDVAAQWVATAAGRRERLAIRPTIWQPDQVRPVYDVLWGTGIDRWAEN
jgi:phage gp46-like protein